MDFFVKQLQLEHSIGVMSYQSQQLLTLNSADDGTAEENIQSEFIDFVLKKEMRGGEGESEVQLQNVHITSVATIPRNQSQTSAVVSPPTFVAIYSAFPPFPLSTGFSFAGFCSLSLGFSFSGFWPLFFSFFFAGFSSHPFIPRLSLCRILLFIFRLFLSLVKS